MRLFKWGNLFDFNEGLWETKRNGFDKSVCGKSLSNQIFVIILF